MAIEIVKTDLANKNHHWEDLIDGEAVFDGSRLFVRTDNGWTAFGLGEVESFGNDYSWQGRRVNVVRVVYS